MDAVCRMSARSAVSRKWAGFHEQGPREQGFHFPRSFSALSKVHLGPRHFSLMEQGDEHGSNAFILFFQGFFLPGDNSCFLGFRV